MVARLVVVALAWVASLLAGCSRQEWVEGGLYSVEGERGGYSIVKILRLDAEGVHIRLYSNHFPERPADIDAAALYMVGMNRKPDEQLGMGHLPLKRASFQDWSAVLIKVVPVEPAELEGYNMWHEAGGGYF